MILYLQRIRPIRRADFTAVVNTTDNDTEYYVDLYVESVDEMDAEILTTDTVTGYVSSIYYLYAEVTEAFTSGTTEESSDDFIERTEEAITTRELISSRAIRTVLCDAFGEIDSVYVAGYGDDEQMRDLVTFDSATVHVGNKADVYVKASYVYSATQLTIDEENQVTIDDTMVADVLAVSLEDNPDAEITYEISSVEENLCLRS